MARVASFPSSWACDPPSYRHVHAFCLGHRLCFDRRICLGNDQEIADDPDLDILFLACGLHPGLYRLGICHPAVSYPSSEIRLSSLGANLDDGRGICFVSDCLAFPACLVGETANANVSLP